MNSEHKIYFNTIYSNNALLFYLIILLFVISTKSNLIPRYKKMLFSKVNKILLKVKGTGTVPVFNPNYNLKPSSYCLNIDQVPKTFSSNSNSNIELPNSENNIILIYSDIATTCNSMFQGCSQITEIDLSYFDSSNLIDMNNMFDGCSSLKSIKFGNFKTSKIIYMQFIFQNCRALETLDLSSFDTSKVEDFHYMFYGCSSLKYLDLSNFDTSSCRCIRNMFTRCSSLTSINLSSFDISKVDLMYEMFYGCSSLISLDLSSFDTHSVQQIYNMFFDCEKLEFVNFKKAQISGTTLNSYENMITNTAKNIVFCVDESKTSILNQLMDLNSCSTRISDCSNWRNYQKKIVPGQTECVDNCSVTSNPIEHFGKCYRECSYKISENSKMEPFDCKIRCPDEMPYEIIETQDCTNICSISQRKRGFCKLNYISKEKEENKESDKELEEQEVENIKKELTNNFDTSDLDNGENIVISQKESTITISTTENQKNEKFSNVSTIDLCDCENKIKEEYKIPKNKSLYILKIDVKQEGLKIPKIEYEVYYPLFGKSLIKLNLTSCKNSKIELSIPVTFTESLDKINSSSEYYNDICYTSTSENGTDISLSDRKNEFINNNLTVCEEDCDFTEYNYTTGKAVCSCKAKIDSTAKVVGVSINKEQLLKSFTDIKNIININVLKCHKLIFTLNSFKRNYGNLILMVIILFFFICLILFYCKDYFYLVKILNMIVCFKLYPELIKNLNIIKKKDKKIEQQKYNPIQDTFNDSSKKLYSLGDKILQIKQNKKLKFLLVLKKILSLLI